MRMGNKETVCGIMGRKGRGWILKTDNPACAPKPTHKEPTSGFQDIGRAMGRESGSLAIASFLCSVDPWSLEASPGWLGLVSWPLEIPLMRPPDGQCMGRKWKLGVFSLSILLKGISSKFL